MASFIDLMGNDRWTEADILNRTEAMIAAEFSPAEVAVLNRIATASALGQYDLTDHEQSQIARYNAVCLAAREAGAAARQDMQLLEKVLQYEAARQVVDSASEDILRLCQLRSPTRPQPDLTAEPVPAAPQGGAA